MHDSGMRVVVSGAAADLVAERGGRLYVWPKKGRCCGGLTWLESKSVAPRGVEFRRVDECDGFDLYLPRALARVPDELQIDVGRFPRRVTAYWDGCAWVA
jgi:hypothetical protein